MEQYDMHRRICWHAISLENLNDINKHNSVFKNWYFLSFYSIIGGHHICTKLVTQSKAFVR